MRILLILTLLLSSLSLYAGVWEESNYTDAYRRVCRLNDKLYILKSSSLVRADCESWQIEKELNRADGLSGSDILDICYSEDADRLAIVYTDGIIDVLHPDGSIWTLPDYANFPMAGARKELVSAREQEGLLFVSTAWGFFVVDLTKEVILQNFSFGFQVNCAWAYEGNWYYSNSDGIFTCSRSANPFLPGAWQKAAGYIIHEALVFTCNKVNQCWLLGSDKTLRKITPLYPGTARCSSTGVVTHLSRAGRYVLASNPDSLVIYDAHFGHCPTQGSTVKPGQKLVCHERTPYAGSIGMASLDYKSSSHLVLLNATEGVRADSLEAELPNIAHMHPLRNEQLTVPTHQQSGLINHVHCGPEGEVGFSYVPLLSMKYGDMQKVKGFLTTYQPADGSWQNYPPTIVSSVSSHKRFVGVDNMIADPNHPGRYWFSTLEDGIYGIEHGQLYQNYDYSSTNGGLTACSPNCTRVSGMAISEEDDLWCVNEGIPNILHVRCASNQKWYSFKIPGLEKSYGFTHLMHTRHGGRHQLWGYQQMSHQISNVFVYDYGTNIPDATDDRMTFFRTLQPEGSAPIIPFYGRGVFEGPDGAIWLLNTSGLYIIDQPDSIFEHPGEVRLVRNDIVPTSMAVDAHNHVWIGTEGNGLYLFSRDGRQEYAHISSSNSILHSNEITSLDYDSQRSTLWITTAGQILSYTYDPDEYGIQSDGVSTAWCFPGSFRVGTHTVVNVFGLMDQSEAQVLNSQSRILGQDTALGGTCSFDASSFPIGTYTVTGTDSAGHRGTLLTFTVEE